MIGNGFDISCGLKTRYVDFINEYLSIKSDNPVITSFKDGIDRNKETWADAEKAFGELPQRIHNSEALITCYCDFLSEMAAYFSKEQARLRYQDFCKSEKQLIGNGIRQFHSTLSEKSKRKVAASLSEVDCSMLNYKFVIFNYTKVCEMLVKACTARATRFKNLLAQNCVCKCGTFEYVHGNLDELPLVFGVDNNNQILHPVLRINDKIKKTLIKPIQNAEERAISLEHCESIIRESDIICIYGMSIGVTDSTWWKAVLNWMTENDKANLIIHCWDPHCMNTAAGNVTIAKDCCRNKFFLNADPNQNTPRSLQDRIHVVVNQDPFHISMHV